MSGPWEDYAQAGQEDGPWSDYASPEMRDAVVDAQPSGQAPPPNEAFEIQGRSQPAMGAVPFYSPPVDPTYSPQFSPTRALLTNDPTRGFGEDVLRGAPAMLGGMVGMAAAAPTGPGSIAAAGLGGAAGEGVRQSAAQLYAGATGRPYTAPGDVMKGMAIQGGLQGAGQGLAVGAAALRPTVNRLGSQVMRVGAGIPEKAGFQAMRNPSMLLDALPVEDAGKAYRTFEGYSGLKGLDALAGERAKAWTAGELYETALQTANKVRAGQAVTAQELYTASQAQNQLSRLAKFGNPDAAAMLGSGSLDDAGRVADRALEGIFPEYAGLRGDYAAAKTAQQFDSWLPLNKNTSPNVLRGVTAATTAAAGVMAGQPGALAALPLVSPKFYGTALKGAALAGKIPAGVYRVGAQSTAGAAGSALEQAYLQRAPR